MLNAKDQPLPCAAVHHIHLTTGSRQKITLQCQENNANRTKLYEEGLITYMRTDAVNLSKEAIEACRTAILKYFGEAYLPKTAKEYKTKSKMRRKHTKLSVRLILKKRRKAGKQT